MGVRFPLGAQKTTQIIVSISMSSMRIIKVNELIRMLISVFPEEETHYVTETLKKEIPKIQKHLYSKLHMKPLPKLSFEIDKTAQEADKVEKLLKEIF